METMVFGNRETMETMVYHGVWKQGNRSTMPWCFETGILWYMIQLLYTIYEKAWSTMVYHVMSWYIMAYHVIPWNFTVYHDIPCNSMVCIYS